MEILRDKLKLHEDQINKLRSTVCKNQHDIAIFNVALNTRVSPIIYDLENVQDHIRRKLMSSHIRDLFGKWISKFIHNFDMLCLTRWFYTQKLVDTKGKDPIFPNNTDKNEGLWYELTRGGVPADQIPYLENLLHQMMKFYYSETFFNIQNRTLEIKKKIEHEYVIYKCEGIFFRLDSTYYNKLCLDYTGPSDQFDVCIYNLLCRYQTLPGSGYHAGITEKSFKVLVKYLRVNHEIFASPFNRTLENYTSAYPDTDIPFGSKGNFFEIYSDLFKDGGSFEANPPFLEEHMAAFALIVINVLSNPVPLSFVVIVPAWIDTVLFHIFMTSKYNVLPNRHYKYERHKHCYRDGGSYIIDNKNERIFLRKSNNKSLVFILQNKLGQEMYPVTPEFENALNEAFSI